MNNRILLIALTIFLFTVSGCGELKEKTSLKLAHGLDVTHPVHKGMEYMAKSVAEKSKGKISRKIGA